MELEQGPTSAKQQTLVGLCGLGGLVDIEMNRIWFLWIATTYVIANGIALVYAIVAGYRFGAVACFACGAYVAPVVWARRHYLFDWREY